MQSLHRKTRLIHSNNPTGELFNILCPKVNALLRLQRIKRATKVASTTSNDIRCKSKKQRS